MSRNEEKERALRRMKIVATGAFLLMALIYGLTLRLGSETLIGPIGWDWINAFSEAAMIGALADWFAVVALFRHPLGIPIWHTAIVPKRKEDISRNLADFVESRLLSVDNLRSELGRFSPSMFVASWLAEPQNRSRLNDWISDGLVLVLDQVDDSNLRNSVSTAVREKVESFDISSLMSKGLKILVDQGRHEELIDSGLQRIAEWLPSHRDTVRSFVDGAIERTLKWGSLLVPEGVVDRATEKTLEALIQVFRDAANNSDHPLRSDVSARIEEWIDKLNDDRVVRGRIEGWKEEFLKSDKLQSTIEGLWDQGKLYLNEQLSDQSSPLREQISHIIDRFADRMRDESELRENLDNRFRLFVETFLEQHHSEIGRLVQRIVDSWDGEELARELELNLGPDLQFIRINGTVIGGCVGLIIHLIS